MEPLEKEVVFDKTIQEGYRTKPFDIKKINATYTAKDCLCPDECQYLFEPDMFEPLGRNRHHVHKS